MPTVNLGRVKPIWRAAYNPAVLYKALDFVASNGTAFVATQNVPLATPPPNATYWAPLNNVGPGLDQIPSNQTLRDGARVTFISTDVLSPMYRGYPIVGSISGNGVFLLRLNAADAGIQRYVGQILTFDSSGSSNHVGSHMSAVIGCNAATNDALITHFSLSEGGTRIAMRVVTLDWAGANYLALRWAGAGARRPSHLLLDGLISNIAGWTLASVPDSECTNVVDHVPSASRASPSPRFNNSSIWHQGNTLVDSNGFIKQV